MKKWKYKTPGIPDEQFIRGEIPMTKEELRSVIISKLRLKRDSIVYDIGAGTGSLTIEAALVANKGKIFAVERKEEGIKLIKDNLDRFEIKNVQVISGQAPEKIRNLPSPDRVIIGGSGGKLEEIIAAVNTKLKTEGRIVITAITINTLHTAVDEMEKYNLKPEIVNVAVTRTREIAGYHMFKGMNPVYIISGEK